MPRRRVILKDIARKAGVHVTTVSLALRNHPRLPEITRKRIRRLRAKWGTSPTRSCARSWPTGAT